MSAPKKSGKPGDRTNGVASPEVQKLRARLMAAERTVEAARTRSRLAKAAFKEARKAHKLAKKAAKLARKELKQAAKGQAKAKAKKPKSRKTAAVKAVAQPAVLTTGKRAAPGAQPTASAAPGAPQA
jgi:uncharacterized protein involved in exopolysaccharide biosynthesis